MSEDEAPQVPEAPPVPQQPPVAMAQAECAQCRNPLTLIIPPFRLMNVPDLTILAMSHEKPQICPKCGAGYIPIIRGLRPGGVIDLQWQRVEYQQQPIIVPPTPQQKMAVEKTKSRGLVLP